MKVSLSLYSKDSEDLPQNITFHEETNGGNSGITQQHLWECSMQQSSTSSVSLTYTSPDKQDDTPSCTKGSETTVLANGSSHTRGQGGVAVVV